jgi:hypothetical protein
LVLKPVAVWGRRGSNSARLDCATATAPLGASSRALDQKVFEDEFNLSVLQRPAATQARYFAPAALYLLVLSSKVETITPMLLARRFTLNPVLVIISLIFWFWMWGVPGAILSVPMLAITKIVCDGVEPLNAIGHFLEGETA